MTDISANAATRSNDISFGLGLMVIAVLISPLIDIFAKLAITTIPSAEITAVRFVLQMIFILPIVIVRGTLFDLTWKKTGLHMLRGGLLVVTMLSFITTLKAMEVADAIAIFFVEPIILTILSSIFLKEAIGWRRYTACGVGFFGAILIIQPSFQEVGYVALLPVVSAVCIAISAMMNRALAQREDPWVMQFHMGLWGLLICAILLYIGHGSGSDVLDPVMPDTRAWLYLLGVGVTAAIAGIFGVYAYRSAPASTLAPLQYFEIVSATAFAWLVFGDFPDALKWLGILIIMGSGFYIIWRERRFASKPVSDTSEETRAP